MNTKKFYAPVAERTHDLGDTAAAPKARRVLIVDDDVALAHLNRLILEKNGYEVDTATDGVQGIKKILTCDYTVILCDMVMPNLAGDMFYLAVERVKPILCKRFLFMTGHGGDKKIDDFVRSIKGLILWKPFQAHVLLESIQVIEDKAAQQ